MRRPIPHLKPPLNHHSATDMSASISAVEFLLDYTFHDKSLLLEALTHPSYANSPSYQRLEFLGDAAVGLAVSKFAYLNYPHVDPGQLSRFRAANVSTERLARVAVRNSLHRYVQHNAAPLSDQVREFLTLVEQERETVLYGGAKKAPKVLADIVESVAAAVYVDCGFNLEILWKVFRKLLDPLVMLNVLEEKPQPVTTLFEFCQKHGKQLDIVQWKKGNMDIASVCVDGSLIAFGSSEQKEIAKLHAAEAALQKLLNSKINTQKEPPVNCLYGTAVAATAKVDEKSELESDMDVPIRKVEELLGHKFINKALLREALTHPSYTDSPNYQRLEFIGDAALGLAISNFAYLHYPDVDPGQLSQFRAANVSTEKLARVAVRHKLYKYVRHDTASLSEKVREFVMLVEQEDEMVIYGGTKKAPKVLADIVESVAAAVYVDCGFNLKSLWMVFSALLQPLAMLNVLEKQRQPVTMLFELCQKNGQKLKFIHWRKGMMNIASVYIDGSFVVSCSSEQKENAKLHAAEAALQKLLNSESNAQLLKDISDQLCEENHIEGAKQKLFELCGKRKWAKPTFSNLENGPSHQRTYICSVQCEISGCRFLVEGDEKPRKKDAENSAAFTMLRALKERI